MEKLAVAFLEVLKESNGGVIIVAIAAIVVAGMSVYGMTVALKKREQ
ncbi:MAG: hypothetical protein NTY36_14740 [Deltaproteobacteria bacterium]|nr:hypothetical protein [Deltaproteobacteria bacterium]